MTMHHKVPTILTTWGEHVTSLATVDSEIFQVMHNVPDAEKHSGSHLVPRFPWKLATLVQYE